MPFEEGILHSWICGLVVGEESGFRRLRQVGSPFSNPESPKKIFLLGEREWDSCRATHKSCFWRRGGTAATPLVPLHPLLLFHLPPLVPLPAHSTCATARAERYRWWTLTITLQGTGCKATTVRN